MKSEERNIKFDRSGESFEIGPCSAADFLPLVEMYRVFTPKPASQGLPPEDPGTCDTWVKKLFDIGENILGWKDDRVVGHASLVPDMNGKSAEFVIFIDQAYRNRGVGTELTRATLEKAKAQGFGSVWLSVEVSNYVAIKLYRKFGFEFCDEDTCERIMLLDLQKFINPNSTVA